MEDNPARVIFAALTLGGGTLLHLKDTIKEFSDKQKLATNLKLQELLQRWLNYDQNYSKWLSENLHRLNKTSILYIEKLKEKASLHVSFSIVIDINEKDKDGKVTNEPYRFDRLINLLSNCPQDRMKIVQGAILKTSDDHITLTISDFKALTHFIMSNDIKKDKARFSNTTLDTWRDAGQQQKE